MDGSFYRLDEQPRGLVMKLSGQFTYRETDEFDREARRLAARMPPLLVLDLSDITMLTSAGIGALLRLQKTMTGLQCTVRMAAPPAEIAQMLQLSRLSDVFQVSRTVDEAFINPA